MQQLRFYVSLATFIAIIVIAPFVKQVDRTLYYIQATALFIGFMLPAGASAKMTLLKAMALWLAGALIGVVLYDYLKSAMIADHVFLKNWTGVIPGGILFFMGIQGYSRFIAFFIFKQLTRPSLR